MPPPELASFYSQIFLGIKIQCAQCHNHPFERWTRNDFFGMAAFLGNVENPVTRSPATPKFLGGEIARLEPGRTPRQILADWITSPGNPYFAQAISDRIWKHFMGVGLVDPVDDFRETNPPTNAPLLAALAGQFARNGYNIKQLMKTIMNSRAYQLSSTTNETNQSDKKNYSHFYARRIYAEPLLDAIAQVTGAPNRLKFGYEGMKAMEAHDSAVPDYFLSTFDRSSRERTCEREENVTLLQTMELISGEAINEKIGFPGGTVDTLISSGLSDREIIEELFLRTVNRYPVPEESDPALQAVVESKTRDYGLQDLLWALINSKEFLFNH